MKKFNNILLLDGIAGTGKSYLVKDLKKEFGGSVVFFKHTCEEVSKKLLENPTRPAINEKLLNDILGDVDRIHSEVMELEDGKDIVIERYLMSTLITTGMSLGLGTLKGEWVDYFSNILAHYIVLFNSISYNEVLYLNIDPDLQEISNVLLNRKDLYYKNLVKYLEDLEMYNLEAMKIAETDFASKFEKFFLISLPRKAIHKTASDFLKGGLK